MAPNAFIAYFKLQQIIPLPMAASSSPDSWFIIVVIWNDGHYSILIAVWQYGIWQQQENKK